MICGSGQPSSSKWWWIGAMRKIRLRRSLNDATCRMTDSASTTKTPPAMTSTSSCLVSSARMPSARAERQGADVAHEHHRRIGVEPQEAEAGADQRRAEDRQLAGAGDVRHLQILGEAGIAGGVGEDAVGEGRGHHRADRQAVEAVGEVDGIGGADQQHGGERNVEQAEVDVQMLEEGKVERGVEVGHEDRGRRRRRGRSRTPSAAASCRAGPWSCGR